MYTPHNHIKVSYSKLECVNNVEDIQNDIVKNTLKHFGITSNIEITTFADIPTVGSGLAGSSAFTCALIRAIAAYKNIDWMTEYDVAELACRVEIDMCGWKIGKQDQYAAAFGGMNCFQYLENGTVWVSRMHPNAISSYCILVPTNIQRHASEVLDKVDFTTKTEVLSTMANIARKHKATLPSFETYAKDLMTSWGLKKQMDGGVSNPEIDKIVEKCMKAGASACKILGAGGGGYVLALTTDKNKIKNKFSDRTCLEIRTTEEGARVVYRD